VGPLSPLRTCRRRIRIRADCGECRL